MHLAARLLRSLDEVVDVVHAEAQMREPELRHRAPAAVAARLRFEPVQQLEANVVASQETRLETNAVAFHRGRDLVAHLQREQLREAEHVLVEPSRSFEIRAT